jgi:poly-gamma-glutamate synthesis protein (capsule biosynthesis protein)
MRLALLVPLLLALALPLEAREVDLTIVAVGDVAMNRTLEKVHPDGILLWGKVSPFSKMTDGIQRYINKKNLNFLNLETTLTDSNDNPPEEKAYNFRSHPNSVKHLLKVGFNLFGFANNHAQDYGAKGIKETRRWLDELGAGEDFWYAGAGEDLDQASDPVVFKFKGLRIAFAAVANGRAATKHRAGVASVHSPDLTLRKLREAKADIRILSMHSGTERKSTPDAVQRNTARRAIDKYKVDLVIGHHPHVVQGVERHGRGLIIYSLGNFMCRGCRDMGSVRELRGERDFGFLARLSLRYDKKARKLTFRKLEALPVYDMHSGPHPFKKQEDADLRIEVLNRLSADLVDGKQPPVVFEADDGKYVHRFKD